MPTMLEDLDPEICANADVISETFVAGPVETGRNGETFRVCHELVDGRWEGFVSIEGDPREFNRRRAEGAEPR